jgi:group II intron reverse transcriptase/maturase
MRLFPRELNIAWKSVRHGGKAPGPDGLTARDFALIADEEIARLENELRAGKYVHGRYRKVWVPKDDGGRRLLCLASFRDRIVQRLLLERLTPSLEKLSSDASFAYRPGRGVKDALHEVARWRDREFTFALRADVQDCFETIRLEVLTQMLPRLQLGDEITQLILEAVEVAWAGEPFQGLPQGAVLSPALCNLVLTPLDDEITALSHVRFIRYADDFVILAQSRRRLEEARRRVAYVLWSLGLRLNERKTVLTDFQHGFRFLGARLVRSVIIPEKPVRYPKRPPGPPTKRRGDGLGYFV